MRILRQTKLNMIVVWTLLLGALFPPLMSLHVLTGHHPGPVDHAGHQPLLVEAGHDPHEDDHGHQLSHVWSVVGERRSSPTTIWPPVFVGTLPGSSVDPIATPPILPVADRPPGDPPPLRIHVLLI